MKQIINLTIALAAGLVLSSCEKAVIDEDALPDEGAKSVQIVQLGLGGEYLTYSEEYMSGAKRFAPASGNNNNSRDKLFAVNVMRKTEGSDTYSHYAYGLFDDPSKIKIGLPIGSLYSFECSIAENNVDTVYYDMNGYRAPFLHGTSVSRKPTRCENKFKYSGDEYFLGLTRGITNINDVDTTLYPRMMRFYGKLDDFDPSTATTATIDLGSCVFGFHFIVAPPSDGVLEISQASGLTPEKITLKAGDNPIDDEVVYTFNRVAKAYKTSYNGSIPFRLVWTRADGSVITDTRKVPVRHNTMTTVEIDLSAMASTNTKLALVEETSEMNTTTFNWKVE